MKIIHIVIRNTSTLDYSIPYLCSLKKKFKKAEICVLYCVLNRKQMLRNAKYYDKVFSEYNIKQYDYSDFLKINSYFLKDLWKTYFSTPYYDNVSFKSYIKNPLFLKGKVIKYILAGLRKRIDEWLCKKYVDIKEIINTLNPDLTLFDHRTTVNFIGKEEFKEFYRTRKNPVILVPHAAHVDNETDEYAPFSLGEIEFPPYCDHWCSFKYAKPHLKVHKSQRGQFAMIGHPGLDSSWLKKRMIASNRSRINGRERNVLKFLILNRKFLPEGIKKPEGMDPGVLEFDDVLKFFKNINSSLLATGLSYKIIVKPHPSSSYPENIRLIKKAKIKEFEISYEPFFELLDEVDLMITEFSTSIAFAVLANVPTVLLSSPLQDYVHGSWHRLEELYSGLRYFVDDPVKDLSTVVMKAVKDNIYENLEFDENDDIDHFRKFYEDNAISRALLRTEDLLK